MSLFRTEKDNECAPGSWVGGNEFSYVIERNGETVIKVITATATCFDDQLLFIVEHRDPEWAPLALSFKPTCSQRESFFFSLS